MIIIHATKKLLNTSRLPAVAYVTKPSENQLLHSWYATTFSSSFPGKMMTIYIHEPSMLSVVCKGKTIKNTWPQFVERLPGVLITCGFDDKLIEAEILLVNDFVVAKTNSRSMLAYMRQMLETLEYNCGRFQSYEEISETYLEDLVMEMLFSSKERRHTYFSPVRYWKKEFE